MPEFQVELSEVQEGCITVAAKNEQEAKRKAFRLINDHGFDLQEREIFRKITYRKVSLL